MSRALPWLGPLVTFAAVVSYFTVFARDPALRDVPWLNLPLALAGVALSIAGLARAWPRGGPWRRLTACAGLTVSLGLAALFVAYVFVISALLPQPERRTLELVEAPDFTLSDESGRAVRLAELRGRKVVLVFYRGFW